jgi:transcriptional regulator with XRE-family HTH domain
MSDELKNDRSFADLRDEFGSNGGEENFPVRSRGRPEMGADEAKAKADRRQQFGDRLKALREAQNLTLQDASDAAGIASARKLSQYETKCYPPGWILTALAPVYKTSAKYLAALKIAMSDPYTFAALAEGKSPEEFCTDGQNEAEEA